MTHTLRTRLERIAMRVCLIRLHEMWPLILVHGPLFLLSLVLRYRREGTVTTVEFPNLDIHYRIGGFGGEAIQKPGYQLTVAGWILNVPITRYDCIHILYRT
jgi:hypothetical protein